MGWMGLAGARLAEISKTYTVQTSHTILDSDLGYWNIEGKNPLKLWFYFHFYH